MSAWAWPSTRAFPPLCRLDYKDFELQELCFLEPSTVPGTWCVRQKKGHRVVKVSWETSVINLILQIKSPRLREGKANCPRSHGQYVVRMTPRHRPVKRRGVGGPVLGGWRCGDAWCSGKCRSFGVIRPLIQVPALPLLA